MVDKEFVMKEDYSNNSDEDDNVKMAISIYWAIITCQTHDSPCFLERFI